MNLDIKELIVIVIFCILYSFAGLILETPILDRFIFSLLGVFNAFAIVYIKETRR